jgi:hypothetical protein
VDAEVVENDHVASLKHRTENLGHIGGEDLGVGRAATVPEPLPRQADLVRRRASFFL